MLTLNTDSRHLIMAGVLRVCFRAGGVCFSEFSRRMYIYCTYYKRNLSFGNTNELLTFSDTGLNMGVIWIQHALL